MESRELISLNDRKKTILFSAVDGYIRDASPVTSQLIHNTVMNDVSTATLRNELNSLEAMGYLTQLHTSSGRVPTTKGYRFFVDELLKNNSFTPKNLDIARKNIFTRTGNISEIVSSIADMVSKTTNYPAVVVLDGFENLSIISIKVVLLITGQMLVLIDTNTGVINNTVSVGVSITKDDCDNASNIFTEVFAGKTLGYLMHNIDSFSDTVRNAMESYKDIFDVVVSMLRVYQHKGTASGGMLKLLDNPEYSDIDKARGVLAVLDDKTKLADIFDTANDDGVSVKIGSENDVEELDNCAVIKTPIVIDGNKVGSVGVIGPKRIDYATVAGILKVITDEINNGGYDER